MPLYGDRQSIHPIARRAWLRAALRQNNTAFGECSVLKPAKRPRQNNLVFLSLWPDIVLVEFGLMVIWGRFRIWHECLFIWCSRGLLQHETFFRTPIEAASVTPCSPVVLRAYGTLLRSYHFHSCLVLLYELSRQWLSWCCSSMKHRCHAVCHDGAGAILSCFRNWRGCDSGLWNPDGPTWLWVFVSLSIGVRCPIDQ